MSDKYFDKKRCPSCGSTVNMVTLTHIRQAYRCPGCNQSIETVKGGETRTYKVQQHRHQSR